MAMKMLSSTAPDSVSYRAIDILFANPPFGSAGFLSDALKAGGAALQALQVDEPEVEPTPEPELSGLAWIEAEFDRLRALPFAASDAGSDTRPKKSARDNSFVCSMYGPAEPLKAAEVIGRQWPYENRITVTVGPRASRAKVSEVLVHELAHAACPTEHGAPDKGGWRRRIHHGRAFREWLVRAAKEAYGLDISPTAAGRSAYKLDAFIIAALEALGGEWPLVIGE